MPPRLLFLVMYSVEPPAVIGQLACALAPHTVLVHQDVSQSTHRLPDLPNLTAVPDPRCTGWANFGFVDGIFHSLRHALDRIEFDYLQLLSPTCLPIKPLSAFEAHVAGAEEIHFDRIDLFADRDALMSVGWRAFTPKGSLRHVAARWLSSRYFGDSPGRRDDAGIWLRTSGAEQRSAPLSPIARLALATVSALADPRIGRHVFDDNLRPYFGSAWFGAKRTVIAQLVEAFERPAIRPWFSRMRIAEEFLFPTLLAQTGARSGLGNHYVHRFDGAHAGWIGEDDFETLCHSAAFFARKFPTNADAPIRQRVLEILVRNDGRSAHADADAAGGPARQSSYNPDHARSASHG